MSVRRKVDFASQGFSKATPNATGHYQDREVIFAQGDGANALFRVKHGHVKLSMASNGNKPAPIAVLNAGDCFGEGCLLSNALRTHTATSLRKSTVARVGMHVMKRRLHQEPALAKLFMRHLLLRIGRVEDDLVDQLVNSSEKRLARLLLQLAGYNGSSGRLAAGVHVDQGTLAQMVGTTRSRVSFFMNRFRKRGFIAYNGTLQVNKGLAAFLEGKHAA
jgi:CRP/FNR family transcriptional regulator, cyclic AMP receptor protein